MRWLPNVLLAILGMVAPALGQEDLPLPESVVKTKTYVSLEPVPRGLVFEVAVVAEVLPGFHINSNKPLEDYLIPTSLQPELPSGIRLLEILYPKGELQKFEFSDSKLSVYDGPVSLRLKLQAAPSTPLGPARLPIILRYQACNDKLCLPPVKLSLTAEFQIAPAGTSARPAHQSIFRKR